MTAARITQNKPKKHKPVADSSTHAVEAGNERWVRVDLHVHTPASHDYEQPEASYLDILKQAERRGLSIIAFTDHNTVNGYYRMQCEVAKLAWLEQLGRILPDEKGRLEEYRRLLKKILVLPGFEFTAAFGFHVLGIFAPNTPQRDLEYLLMSLRVPGHVLERGLNEVGGTCDVLQAYRAIDEAGGIAIAAHANSTNGVAMRGMRWGGQTRIAFTQDPHLHALEFTDLDRGRQSAARLFSGAYPEYSRRMFIVQGSDAHGVVASKSGKRLGVGDRVTEVKLAEVSFEALRALLKSQHFDRVRPAHDVLDLPEDVLAAALQQGPGARIAFHLALPRGNNRFAEVLRDICALANGEGGEVFIGCAPGQKSVGLHEAHPTMHQLGRAIVERITPKPDVSLAVRMWEGVHVLHVSVRPLDDAPCALDHQSFFVRDGARTRLASRDEIVALARRQLARPATATKPVSAHTAAQPPLAVLNHEASTVELCHSPHPLDPTDSRPAQRGPGKDKPISPTTTAVETAAAMPTGSAFAPLPDGAPHNGIQVLAVAVNGGAECFVLRDLRNNSIIRDVTRASARDLWLYAINWFAKQPAMLAEAHWHGQRALLSREFRAGRWRYDLALMDANGVAHVFYGVTEDGLDEHWRELIDAALQSEGEAHAAGMLINPMGG